MIFEYTYKLKLSITYKEILKYAMPLCSLSELKKHVENELMQCASGIVNGEFGGEHNGGWERQLFIQLAKDGIIELTQKGKETFS